MLSNMKFRPVVQKEMLFKEKVYGPTDDGQRLITIALLELKMNSNKFFPPNSLTAKMHHSVI